MVTQSTQDLLAPLDLKEESASVTMVTATICDDPVYAEKVKKYSDKTRKSVRNLGIVIILLGCLYVCVAIFTRNPQLVQRVDAQVADAQDDEDHKANMRMNRKISDEGLTIGFLMTAVGLFAVHVGVTFAAITKIRTLTYSSMVMAFLHFIPFFTMLRMHRLYWVRFGDGAAPDKVKIMVTFFTMQLPVNVGLLCATAWFCSRLLPPLFDERKSELNNYEQNHERVIYARQSQLDNGDVSDNDDDNEGVNKKERRIYQRL